ncbi:MAG: hypothetical protein RLY86_2141 [Pseudomonadota bacterium]|jgi:uncharacterized heparinase superfamily protein
MAKGSPRPGRLHRRFTAGSRAWLRGTALYSLTTLSGRAPTGLSAVPPDPWPGDAGRGVELLNNVFRFAGQTLSGEQPPWLDDAAGPAWLGEMHGFDWLRDLRAVGGDAARRQARLLVDLWIERHGRWSPVAWAPDVTAARLCAWIGQHDFFLASADDALRARIFDSMARQMRHLQKAVPGRLKGHALLLGLKGMIYGGLCLPGFDGAEVTASRLLVRELPRQILPDGGHVERSPAVQLQVLRHLVDLRSCYRAARAAAPEAVQHAIDRMAPTLRFFRHGDGGLALFNGTGGTGGSSGGGGTGSANGGEAGVLIDTVLGQADAKGRPLKSLPHIGFERLTGGRACILMDTGAPPPPGLDEVAHAGTLSFEMSVGRERLIVNCGGHPSQVGPWRTGLAATAAHSTLVLADTNSAAVKEDGGLGRRPAKVEVVRQDGETGTLVEAAHDGWRESHGLVHRRRLFLFETGEDLRGEDTLEGPGPANGGATPFTICFHLHPAVQVGLLNAGDAALLRGASGQGWRFRVRGGVLELAESVYLGSGVDPRKSVQLVIRGTALPGVTTVKWALRREKPAAQGPGTTDGDGGSARATGLTT